MYRVAEYFAIEPDKKIKSQRIRDDSTLVSLETLEDVAYSSALGALGATTATTFVKHESSDAKKLLIPLILRKLLVNDLQIVETDTDCESLNKFLLELEPIRNIKLTNWHIPTLQLIRTKMLLIGLKKTTLELAKYPEQFTGVNHDH